MFGAGGRIEPGDPLRCGGRRGFWFGVMGPLSLSRSLSRSAADDVE